MAMQDDLVTLSQAPDAGAQDEQQAPAATAAAVAPAADVAPAATQQAVPSAAETGEKTAVARVRAITTSEEGRALPQLAEHLAFETNLSLEAAIGAMKAAAADRPAASTAATSGQSEQSGLGNALTREMAKTGNAAGVRPEGEIKPAEPENDLAEKAKAFTF